MGSYIDFCKSRLSQFGSCATFANVQKSKRGVPRKDLSPQTEGTLIASTNLETSLTVQFPMGKELIRIGAPKKMFAFFAILNDFIN